MVPTEFRVWREVDNRAKDGKLIDAMQDEIAVLRREYHRLVARVAELDAQLGETFQK